MFVRGMSDFVNRNWKMENWLQVTRPAPIGTPEIIPGVSNTVTAVAGGGLGLAALAALAWYLTRK